MKLPRFIGLDIHRDRIYVTELSIFDNNVRQYEITTREKDLEAFLRTLSKDDQVALEATRGSNYYVSRLSPRGWRVSGQSEQDAVLQQER